MATPHVSGLAALLISQGITSPVAIEAAIKQFATDKGPADKMEDKADKGKDKAIRGGVKKVF